MITRCQTCEKQWTGYKAEHCASCHETFSSTTAGDEHRKGKFPDGRYCDTSDLEWNEKRQLWKLPGTWSPEDEG